MDKALTYTEHACLRLAQRNLSERDVDFVLRHGRRIRSGGVLHVFLGRKDIPADRALQRRFGRLEGATLVLDDTHEEITLITAYRNRNGLHQIRAKRKMDFRTAR